MSALGAALQVLAKRIDGDRVISKGHLDIATGTDLKSQEVIRAILMEAHPAHAFVAEEAGQHVAPRAESYWLVDPICGTANFASRLPLYCVNIALVERGCVVLGAVGDGASGEVWVAERGRGAWTKRDTRMSRTSVADRSAILVLDPGRPQGVEAVRRSTVIQRAISDGRWGLRSFSSTVDLAYLAEGRVAGVWHPNTTAPLHFAAGTLLAAEAGALVSDEDGEPWSLASTTLVAAATPVIHDALLNWIPPR
ncbi:MAG: inositol monophosphatase family protein [Candidatus Dormibacteria bacterium]